MGSSFIIQIPDELNRAELDQNVWQENKPTYFTLESLWGKSQYTGSIQLIASYQASGKVFNHPPVPDN